MRRGPGLFGGLQLGLQRLRFREQADLETTFGISGVDMLGSACGVLSFSDDADIEDGETSGSLEIATRSCADDGREPSRLTEFLSWCSGSCDNGAPTPWFNRAGIMNGLFE